MQARPRTRWTGRCAPWACVALAACQPEAQGCVEGAALLELEAGLYSLELWPAGGAVVTVELEYVGDVAP